MAASLPGLPAELLLNIVETERYFWKQRPILATLRALNHETNNKLVDFYGDRHCSHIEVELNRKGILQIQAIARSRLRFHVESIVVECDTILDERSCNPDSESSDAEDCSFYPGRERYTKIKFDEDVAEIVGSGLVISALRQALPNLPELEAFSVRGPTIMGSMEKEKTTDVKGRWLIAAKSLLGAVCAEGTTVRELSIHGGRCYHLPVPISALDVVPLHWAQSTALAKLCLNVVVDVPEATVNMYIRCLVQIFTRSPALAELEVSFLKSSAPFFKQFANALPSGCLRRLVLCHVVTRYKYLAKALRCHKKTLRSLTLDRISLSKSGEQRSLLLFLAGQLKLTRCIMDKIIVAEHSLSFERMRITRVRTDTIKFQDEEWVRLDRFEKQPLSRLSLDVDKGDDVRDYLKQASWSSRTLKDKYSDEEDEYDSGNCGCSC
ncbi:hypothetical protein NX059_008678 [Plenodomus lindquistii]|nr:hypothetical protein NX059_008678 [Plenodomus lindquistii]